jgi:hypothetical protein
MRYLLLFLILLSSNIIQAQKNCFSASVSYGCNLPVFNKTTMGYLFNRTISSSYTFSEIYKKIGLVPELYQYHIKNMFETEQNSFIVNNLNSLGINLGLLLPLNNNKLFFKLKLGVKYTYSNELRYEFETNKLNINGISALIHNVNLTTYNNNFIPTVEFSTDYLILKRFYLGICIGQSLINNYKKDMIYFYDNINHKSVNFNVSETKISLVLTYNFKKYKPDVIEKSTLTE